MGESVQDDVQDDDLREPFAPKSHKYAWRRRVAANPVTEKSYRTAVALIGLLIVAVGILAIPLPGPGWLIVFLGLGVWATEFVWAAKLLAWVRRKVDSWNDWFQQQPMWFKVIFGLATFVFVCCVVWLVLRLGGVPAFLPSGLKDLLHSVPGL